MDTDNMPNAEDTKVIIQLLTADKQLRDARQEKTDASMEHLHECVHNIDVNVSGIKSYFIGIDPQKHIIHHVRMEETAQMNSNIKKAVVGALVSMAFTGVMAFMQWTSVQAQKDMQTQITEIVKQQREANVLAPKK